MKRRSLVATAFAVMIAFASLLVVTSAQSPDSDESPGTLPWVWTLGSLREYRSITVGDDTLVVEIADDGALRERGLSYRDGLEPGTGMLFVYPAEGVRSFWMKEMRFCLDIIWLGETEIVGAAENACPEPGVSDANLARYQSNAPVRFILEVPANWMNERGYGAGTPIDLSSVIDD
jgi:uncharacterized membrane protein (UPF0127 family)